MKITLVINSCFIQYNAPLKETVIVTQKIYSFRQEFYVFSHFQLQFSVSDVCIVSVTLNYNIQLFHISLETYAYVSATIV